MSDDAGWQFLGSAKEASDRAARLGRQSEGVRRPYPQSPTDSAGGGSGMLGTLLYIFAVLLLEALKIAGQLLLWTLDMMLTGGRRRRR